MKSLNTEDLVNKTSEDLKADLMLSLSSKLNPKVHNLGDLSAR